MKKEQLILEIKKANLKKVKKTDLDQIYSMIHPKTGGADVEKREEAIKSYNEKNLSYEEKQPDYIYKLVSLESYEKNPKQVLTDGRSKYNLIEHKKNYVVYQHSRDKSKIIVGHRGTADLADVALDGKLALGLGSIKDEKRYKDADKFVKNFEEQQKNNAMVNKANVSFTGHSLGGKTANAMAGKDKHSVTYNGFLMGDSNQDTANVTNYRNKTDIVSFLGRNNKNTKTQRGNKLGIFRSHLLKNLNING